MKTEITHAKNRGAVAKAVSELKKSNLIVLPTDTVYGIACNAFDKKALKKLFRAKKRPAGKPIAVLIGNKKDVDKIAKEIPLAARELIKKHWPGALTLVLKKRKSIPKMLTGNKETVAVRMPADKTALKIIRRFGKPIAASSANPLGKKIAENAEQALLYFDKKIPLIVDGGKNKKGKASKIIDCTQKPFKILRK